MVNLFSASDDEAADEAAAASSGGLCDPFVSAMWGSWSWVTIGLIGIITTIMGLTIINYDYYMGYNGIIVNYNGIYKWDELSLAYHWIIWDLVSKWILICFFFCGLLTQLLPWPISAKWLKWYWGTFIQNGSYLLEVVVPPAPMMIYEPVPPSLLDLPRWCDDQLLQFATCNWQGPQHHDIHHWDMSRLLPEKIIEDAVTIHLEVSLIHGGSQNHGCFNTKSTGHPWRLDVLVLPLF